MMSVERDLIPFKVNSKWVETEYLNTDGIKRAEWTIGSSNVSDNYVVGPLVARGTDENQRLGNHIRVWGLNLRLRFTTKEQAVPNSAAIRYCVGRMIVYVDKQSQNQGFTGISPVSNNFDKCYDDDYVPNRLEIILDENINFHPVTPVYDIGNPGGNDWLIARQAIAWKKSVTFTDGLRINYVGDTTMAWADKRLIVNYISGNGSTGYDTIGYATIFYDDQ